LRVRVVEGVREREKGEKKRTGMCNEWQVGNFETQKQPKAGSKVLSILYCGKAVFDFGFWLLVKAKAAKSPTKGTL
jgi:hypothetical protein